MTATATRSRSRKPAATTEKRDVYQEVTDQIVALLEEGTVPWHKPWAAPEQAPRSVASGNLYQGLNVLILAMKSMTNGYDSPWWLTFKEAVKRGGTLKGEKGSAANKGTQIVYWNFFKTTDKVTGKEKTVPTLRFFYVWNIEQFEFETELKLPKLATTVVEREHDRNEACDEIINGYVQRTGLSLAHGGNSAHYVFATDHVQLPHLKHFETAEEYYGAAFHELAHSTGHASRLNRPGIADVPVGHKFGDELYSEEELVAELASAFLSAQTGIVAATVNNTAAYLQNWTNALQGDKRLIIRASGAATKAAKLVMGTEEQDKADDAAETA
jgi:antirestriction protein ArdC